MNVKKFIAANSREALRKVRDALGPEAVILSNRSVAEGVEIMAMADADIASLANARVEPEAEAALDFGQTAAAFRPSSSKDASRQFPAGGREFAGTSTASATPATSAASSVTGHSTAMPADMARMMQEVREMRQMLAQQMADMAWDSQRQRNPAHSVLLRELLSAGFSPALSRHVLAHLPEGKTAESGLAWVKSALARNLQVLSNEQDVLDRGGIFALVGPTGVGKTTTTAKLAARCVMRHGAHNLALITTDGYRIGGHEQLRIYGKILGVMVHTVRDESDLRIALAELRNKHTILIDTVGMNQRDQMVAEQVAMLSGANADVRRLLCLNATSTGETLNEVVRAYQGSGLAGCIVTKLDEAATMGNVLDVMIRNKLLLYYAANGQRVPEDLHLMNRELLVDRAFRVRREMAAFRYDEDDLSVLMGSVSTQSMREVSFG